jgi:hypothetical protein
MCRGPISQALMAGAILALRHQLLRFAFRAPSDVLAAAGLALSRQSPVACAVISSSFVARNTTMLRVLECLVLSQSLSTTRVFRGALLTLGRNVAMFFTRQHCCAVHNKAIHASLAPTKVQSELRSRLVVQRWSATSASDAVQLLVAGFRLLEELVRNFEKRSTRTDLNQIDKIDWRLKPPVDWGNDRQGRSRRITITNARYLSGTNKITQGQQYLGR